MCPMQCLGQRSVRHAGGHRGATGADRRAVQNGQASNLHVHARSIVNTVLACPLCSAHLWVRTILPRSIKDLSKVNSDNQQTYVIGIGIYIGIALVMAVLAFFAWCIFGWCRCCCDSCGGADPVSIPPALP